LAVVGAAPRPEEERNRQLHLHRGVVPQSQGAREIPVFRRLSAVVRRRVRQLASFGSDASDAGPERLERRLRCKASHLEDAVQIQECHLADCVRKLDDRAEQIQHCPVIRQAAFPQRNRLPWNSRPTHRKARQGVVLEVEEWVLNRPVAARSEA
jgi:hypothetical protein